MTVLGVDESIKHKVFEPFTTTKRGEGASGLGHGASIEINFPIN